MDMGIGMIEFIVVLVVGGAFVFGGLAVVGLLIYSVCNKQKTSHDDVHAKDQQG